MLNNIIMYFIALVIFLLLDFIWLAFIARKPYKKLLGYLMKEKPNFTSAFIFYLIYVIGLMFFVIKPALAINSWFYALYAGGLFGFIAYATYDLTNLATIKDWPLKITIADLIWGSFVSSSTSTLAYLVIIQIF